MKYKIITYDNDRFNHYVVYENGQICKTLKSGEHRALKYTIGKKGGIKVTLCANKYRKSVSVNHIIATEFLGEILGEFDTVEPIDGNYSNTHKDNLKVVRKYKQIAPEFPNKKEGALRHCKVCDYRAETKEQLKEFVKVKEGDGTEYGRRNLCKSCRQAERNIESNGGVLCSRVVYPEKIAAKMSYLRHREARKAAASSYQKDNRAKCNARSAKRRAKKLNATPKWLTEDDYWMMQIAYETAKERTEQYGIEFEVDHIIPLNGKLVSGFHCPENLQVIPWHENLEKSNKFEPYWVSQQLKG